MSHRDDCKDPREARREGEHAYERGYGVNPYHQSDYNESWEDRRCREEAESAWRRGYYAAEQQAEEEAAARAAQRRQEEARFEEEAYYEMEIAAREAEYQMRHPEPPEE